MFAANLFLDTLNMQCKSKEVIAWTRKFIDMPELASDAGFTSADDLAAQRRLPRGRGQSEQARRPQGVRAVVPGGGRGAARTRQTRRAAVERRAVLPERAPHRPGDQGVDGCSRRIRTDPLAKRALLPHRRRLSAAGVLREGGHFLRSRSPRRFRASRRRGARWPTRRCSARGCGRLNEALADMDAYVASTARAIRRTRPASSSRRARSTSSREAGGAARPPARATSTRWGKQGGARSPGAGALPPGRDRVEGVVRARVGRRRLPARRPHDRDAQPCSVIEAANRKLGTAQRTQCGPATKSKITVF